MSPDSYVLASDLDGTLIPPETTEGDGGIAEFERTVRDRADLWLAYVTGRHRTLALDGITHYRLPAPDVLVCDVGTSVFRLNDGVYEPDPVYRERMSANLGGADRSTLHQRLRHLPGLRLQEEERQADFKLSYYAPLGSEGEALARRAAELLEDQVGGANVVFSVDPVSESGLIDVLPAGVAKDAAVQYLHDHFGVQEDRLVYAGDSGNDRAALLSGFNVVVVGNASHRLKESILAEARARGLVDRIHFADAWYALGVLEGCRRFEIL